jgi:hypothetical protein
MGHNEEHLPEDVRDIAERLTESRASFTPIELDGLRERLKRRLGQGSPSHGRRLSRLRMKSIAGVAAIGLMLTAGAGVVIAGTSISGGTNAGGGNLSSFSQSFNNTFRNTSLRHDPDASFCQYQTPVILVFRFVTPSGTLIIRIVITCNVVHISITFIANGGSGSGSGSDSQGSDSQGSDSNPGFEFGFNQGHRHHWRGSSYNTNAPDWAKTMTVKVGRSSHTVPVNP